MDERTQLSIENWLRINLGPIKWQSGDTEMTVNCPFCPAGDTGYHLNVAVNKPVCNCFRCSYTGSWYNLIKDVSGVESAADITAQLQNPTASPISDFVSVADRLALRHKAAALKAYDMPEWFAPFSLGEWSAHGAIVLEYALSRLTFDQVIQHNIGYCIDPERSEALRLVIPIEDGYYQARSIQQHHKPKYINPPITIGGRLFNSTALHQYKVVTIAEGAISAIACGPGGVATLGNKATAEQMIRLLRAPVERYIIAYDAGYEYSKPIIELAETLQGAGKLVSIRQFKNGDPADNTGYVDVEYWVDYKVMVESRLKRRR